MPEVDGAGQAVAEWLEKLELVCLLRGVTHLHSIVSVRLYRGSIFCVPAVQQHRQRKLRQGKSALTSAFAVDKFIAFEQFVGHRLSSD